jgi:hypothetical protein
MRCKVYRLYDHGVRLDKHAAQQNSPKVGRLGYELSVRAPTVELTVFVARLFATGSDQLILPVLNGARLLRVNDDGLLLHGTEVVPGRGGRSPQESYKQSWLCKLG